jgi:hypothetical protein
MALDRVESELLPITHDFLATMLGTDRPSVSVAAALLQKSQIIQYRRGSLRGRNRKKLEKFTCECYATVQQYAGGKGEQRSQVILRLSRATHDILQSLEKR